MLCNMSVQARQGNYTPELTAADIISIGSEQCWAHQHPVISNDLQASNSSRSVIYAAERWMLRESEEEWGRGRDRQRMHMCRACIPQKAGSPI